MKITRTGQSFHLDWHTVFDIVEELPVTFRLIIGSQAMYTDILEKQFLTTTQYDVEIPKSTVVTQSVTEIYFTLYCSYPTGLYSAYRTSYHM